MNTVNKKKLIDKETPFAKSWKIVRKSFNNLIFIGH